jgi:transposase
MLKLDQVYLIWHKVLVEGLSIRSVAREMDISRDTVAKLPQEPRTREDDRSQTPSPVKDMVASRIDELLYYEADIRAGVSRSFRTSNPRCSATRRPRWT